MEKAFLEEYAGGLDELAKGRYKNATILLSKALFALCDLLLFSRLGKLPKNHSERFRLLEENFPDIYTIVDAIFGHYTDAYSKPILKETCEEIQNGIAQIVQISDVPEEIKKTA